MCRFFCVRLGLIILSLVLVPRLASAIAPDFSLDTDSTFDRWMYPFNVTPGVRGLAPLFGSVGAGAFDNRDGQLIVGFDAAAAGLIPGLDPKKYEIISAKVQATHFSGTFDYDPTYDSYQTYDGTLADGDAGRPLELYALSFRNGFAFGQLFPGAANTPPGFLETDAYGFGDPTLPGIRLAYPDDLVNGDISNHVDNGFESLPLAVGQSTSGLNPGDSVPEGVAGVSSGETFEFEIDLNRPEVLEYLQQGLSHGGLFFAINSLHAASQTGPGVTPNLYTSNNFDPAAVAPRLLLEVNVVPEPSTIVLSIFGIGLVLTQRRSRA